MTVELTPEVEAIVVDRLSSGRYSSANAVIEEALHAVQDAHALKNGQQKSSFRQLPPEERVRKMQELFAEIDAAGGFEFEVERDRRPPEQREGW